MTLLLNFHLSQLWYIFSNTFIINSYNKYFAMKTYSKITLGAAALAFTAIMIASKKKATAQKQISEISNEGYETAADILNLNKGKSLKKMHFGPVLPHHTF
jgi:hypothetical protein